MVENTSYKLEMSRSHLYSFGVACLLVLTSVASYKIGRHCARLKINPELYGFNELWMSTQTVGLHKILSTNTVHLDVQKRGGTKITFVDEKKDLILDLVIIGGIIRIPIIEVLKLEDKY